MTDDEIIARIHAYEAPEMSDDYIALENLVADALAMKDPARAVPAFFDLMERHPDADLGSPGPVVHFVERFLSNGYEEHLLDSVRRKPTPLTVWLLHRVANSGDPEDRALFLGEIQRIACSEFDQAAEAARSFLEAE